MRLRYATLLIFILVVFTASSAFIVARRNAINAQCPRGLIVDRTKWPKYLLETIESLQRNGFLPEQIDGFRMHAWSNDQFALRFLKADVSTDGIANAMTPTRVGDDNVGVRQFRNHMPKEWSLVYRPTAEYYVSSAWLTGGEGDMYVLRIDSSEEFVYLYYYYNF